MSGGQSPCHLSDNTINIRQAQEKRDVGHRYVPCPAPVFFETYVVEYNRCFWPDHFEWNFNDEKSYRKNHAFPGT